MNSAIVDRLSWILGRGDGVNGVFNGDIQIQERRTSSSEGKNSNEISKQLHTLVILQGNQSCIGKKYSRWITIVFPHAPLGISNSLNTFRVY